MQQNPSLSTPSNVAGAPADGGRELAYSLDEERYITDLDDILGRLDDAGSLVEGATYWVGEKVQRSPDFFTEGAAQLVVEYAQDQAQQDAHEFSEGFGAQVPSEALTQLERLIAAWADIHLPVDFFTVTNVRRAKVTAQDVAEYRSMPAVAPQAPAGTPDSEPSGGRILDALPSIEPHRQVAHSAALTVLDAVEHAGLAPPGLSDVHPRLIAASKRALTSAIDALAGAVAQAGPEVVYSERQAESGHWDYISPWQVAEYLAAGRPVRHLGLIARPAPIES